MTNGALHVRADVVAEKGRIYAIAYGIRDTGDASLRADLDAIVASFRFPNEAEVRAIPQHIRSPRPP